MANFVTANTMTVAIGLFAATYLGLLIFAKYRAYVALASAIIFVALGLLPIESVFGAIDWNVILMIAGTMGTVFLFIESKMPAKLADIIIEKTPNVKWAIVSLSLLAGIISAFVDNVATVIMIAPIALGVTEKLKISPVKFIIAICIASNLQGAATLVGDTTSIMLGAAAGIDFSQFFFLDGKIGLFWIVQLATVAATLVLLFATRKDTEKIEMVSETVVEDLFPTVLMVGTVVLLILISFIPDKPDISNGIVCVALFIIGLIYYLVVKKDKSIILRSIKDIDYFTLLLLGSLFVVIAAITHVGVVDEISKLFVSISGDSPFIIYTLIVWASVLFSAFIDNIPYVATMLPVVASISTMMGISPYLLYFGLLSGATLGGNLTPIGASANITGQGILRKAGYKVSAGEFMRLSIPYTLAAVVVGYALVWIIWA
jgi:Na+/H+ antiporter NhaD and related arsenite permeases